MIDAIPDQARRTLLQSAVGLVIGQMGLDATAASTNSKKENNVDDFMFLTGNWKISNRRLKSPGDKTWDEFPGEATVWSMLGGMASIEELRIPARNFAGMGVRVFHIEKKLWADHWVSGKNGILNEPMMGSFENGVGTFMADEMENGKPIKARGVWDRITPNSCRWHQATSSDGGKTWEPNWFMDWVRV